MIKKYGLIIVVVAFLAIPAILSIFMTGVGFKVLSVLWMVGVILAAAIYKDKRGSRDKKKIS